MITDTRTAGEYLRWVVDEGSFVKNWGPIFEKSYDELTENL